MVEGQGWHGDTPGHEKAALKGQARNAMNNPMLKEAIKSERFEPPIQTTCQICARPIKSKSGIIAHHGYKRPQRGSGWQTASCAGARHLPYEVSCDVLPPTIETIKNFIILKENQLKEFIANPPESLKINLGGYYTTSTKEVVRPDDFDYKSEKFGYAAMRFNTYENKFRSIVENIKQDIKFAKTDLQFMEERLAKWVPAKGV